VPLSKEKAGIMIISVFSSVVSLLFDPGLRAGNLHLLGEETSGFGNLVPFMERLPTGGGMRANRWR
jgi:hypothetical protein